MVGESAKGDISRFYSDGQIPAGKQLADIYVNQVWKGQFDINVEDNGKQISIAQSDVPKLGLKPHLTKQIRLKITHMFNSAHWHPIYITNLKSANYD